MGLSLNRSGIQSNELARNPSTVPTEQQTQSKSFLKRAYHRAFHMGALKPHAKTLLPYFNSTGGKFVEVGARDGLHESITPYLEKALGWQGLLIEPWPHLFHRCRKNRKSSVALNVAASERLLCDSYIEVVGLPPAASIRQKLMQEARERIEGKPIEAPIPGQAKAKQIHYVSTNSIEGILERAHFDKHFDLMVFNLVGYEAKALDGMNFDHYKPTFLLIRTESETIDLPNLPPYYQRIIASKHTDGTLFNLFRFSDFGVN